MPAVRANTQRPTSSSASEQRGGVLRSLLWRLLAARTPWPGLCVIALGLLVMIDRAREQWGFGLAALGILWILVNWIRARRSRNTCGPKYQQASPPPARARAIPRANQARARAFRGMQPAHFAPTSPPPMHEVVDPIPLHSAHSFASEDEMPMRTKQSTNYEPYETLKAMRVESQFAEYNESGMQGYDDFRHR